MCHFRCSRFTENSYLQLPGNNSASLRWLFRTEDTNKNKDTKLTSTLSVEAARSSCVAQTLGKRRPPSKRLMKVKGKNWLNWLIGAYWTFYKVSLMANFGSCRFLTLREDESCKKLHLASRRVSLTVYYRFESTPGIPAVERSNKKDQLWQLPLQEGQGVAHNVAVRRGPGAVWDLKSCPRTLR